MCRVCTTQLETPISAEDYFLSQRSLTRKRKAPARLGEEEDEPMSSIPEDSQRKEYSVKLSPVCFVQEDLHGWACFSFGLISLICPIT